MGVPAGSTLQTTSFTVLTNQSATLHVSEVLVTIGSELMENHEQGLSISAENPFQVAQDSDGNPLIFSTSTSGSLYVVVRDSAQRTGWNQIDLSTKFSGRSVDAFRISQKSTGEIFIAVAVAGADAQKSDLFITKPISNNLRQTIWTQSDGWWVPRPNDSGQDWKVTELLVTPPDEAESDPGIVAVVRDPGATKSTYFIVSGDPWQTTSPLWVEFPPPTDDTAGIEVALGRINDVGNRGLYMLYDDRGQRILVFKPFPIILPNGNQSNLPVRQLTPPPGARALEVTPGDGRTTELYVGGDGVFVFTAGNQAKNATALEVGRGAFTTAYEVLARPGPDGVAVWALDQTGTLFYTYRSNVSAAWSPPLPLHKGASQIASKTGTLRNRIRNANELFVVDDQNRLLYLWQDPRSSVWQVSQIPLHSLKDIVTFNSYSTTIRFSAADKQTLPPGAVSLSLSASAWTYVTINGRSHILDERPLSGFQPDIQGKFNIVVRAAAAGVPTLTIDAGFLTKRIHVDPSGHVHARLAGMSKQDWLAAQYPQGPQKGQTLVTGPDSDQNADIISQSLGQMHQVGKQVRDSNLKSRYGADIRIEEVSDLVFLTSEAAVPAAPMAAAASSPKAALHGTWGVSFGAKGPMFHAGPEGLAQLRPHLKMAMPLTAAASFSIGDVISDLGHAIETVGGDILQSLENGLIEAGAFLIHVADNVAHFFVRVGEAVYHFVLDTIELVRKAIGWLLKAVIGLLLFGLLLLLGFLFDWDEIKKTLKVVMNLVNQTLAFSKAEIALAKGQVAQKFDDLKAWIKGFKDKTFPGNYGSANSKQESAKYLSDGAKAAEDVVGFLTGNPVANWLTDHILNSGLLSGDPLDLGLSATLEAAFKDFAKDVIEPALSHISDDTMTFFTDLQVAFAGGMTPDQAVKYLADDVLYTAIDVVGTVITGLMKFVEDLIDLFKSLINKDLDLPFVSALYSIKIGGNFTILAGMAMITSAVTIPAYLVVSGRKPFDDGTDGLETLGYESLFAALRGKALPRATAPEKVMAAERAPQMLLAAAAPAAQSGGPSVATRYSHVGGLIYAIANGSYRLMGFADALTPSGAGNKMTVTSTTLASLALDIVAVSCSFPVGSADAVESQYWFYAVNGMDLVKDAIVMSMAVKGGEDSAKAAGKAVGIYLLFTNLTKFVLSISTLYLELTDSKEPQKGWDVEKFVQNLTACSGGIANSVTKLSEDEETKAISAAIGAGLSIIASLLQSIRVAANVADEIDHHAF